MAAPTYKTTAIVLRKTKLGESDLILTLLVSDGSQLQVVAKGARKPTSSFSSRLELYCVVQLLCCKGRSLDIVKEARLLEGNEAIRFDIAKATAAAPMAEVLCKLSQPGLESTTLYEASLVAFRTLNSCESRHDLAVCAAHLLKVLSYSGFRPSFGSCSSCAGPLSLDGYGSVRFSAIEGGVVCDECAPQLETVLVPFGLIMHARSLMHVRFSEIESMPFGIGANLDALRLARDLIHTHAGCRLKSLEFLLTQAFLFEEN